jgi:spermidine/putrescine transport system permease protein
MHVDVGLTGRLHGIAPFRLRRSVQPLLMLPAAGAFLVFFVAPLVLLVVYSFLTAGLLEVTRPFTLANYAKTLHSTAVAALGQNSAEIGAITAVVTVAVAMPVAYWLRYSSSRLRLPVLFLVTASLFASYLVRIYAWRTLLGDHGIINAALHDVGLVDRPLTFLLYNKLAVVIALVHIFLPYVVLVLYAGLGPIHKDYLEAAQDLGATSPQRWLRVLLPLLATPATAAFMFVFIRAAGDYVTPQFLGGTNGSMLGVLAQSDFTVAGDWGSGAATAILMLLGFLGCYLIALVPLRRLGLRDVKFAA